MLLKPVWNVGLITSRTKDFNPLVLRTVAHPQRKELLPVAEDPGTGAIDPLEKLLIEPREAGWSLNIPLVKPPVDIESVLVKLQKSRILEILF